jgi:threonine dehydratase
MPASPTYASVLTARDRIAPYVHVTPVLTSGALDASVGAALYFKCENFQKVGAFKARGAHNAVLALSETDAARGVVTHSSGNHGAALALAARTRGIPAWVVVPEGALASKIAAIKRYGATVVPCEATLAARESTAARVQAETGARLVHPYNDPWVIAGQGTAALELLEQVSGLNAVVTPVGGGGLLSGTALAVKGANAGIAVYGAEPAGADDAARSMAAGVLIPQTSPNTIADGLRSSLGDLTWPIIQRDVAAVLTATEPQILGAMRELWEVLKIVVEPSSAVAFAAVKANLATFSGRRVGIVLTGGNVDLDRHLEW